MTLHDHTLLGLLIFPGGQGGPGGVLEYLSHALVRLRRALEVLLGTDLLADVLGLSMGQSLLPWWPYRVTDLFWGHRLLGGLVQLLNGLLVITEILLAANEDDGKTLAEVQNLGNPLCPVSDTFPQGLPGVSYLLLDVVERIG